MTTSIDSLQDALAAHGQEHVLRYWEELTDDERAALAAQIEEIDLAQMERLIDIWVKNEPKPEHFDAITPVPVVPPVDPSRADAKEALAAGEDALRAGRIGLVVVAGGQGTRLGYDGPKGAYPIGALTERTLFAYHADKIHGLQRRYGVTLPWFVMVSDTNRAETEAYFQQHAFFGLDPADLKFFQQKMVPCVDANGKYMLDSKGVLAMNPNGHGGSLLALIDEGIVAECRSRGIDTLSYFQVDNWAVKVADPYFLGYHLLGQSEFSSKVHRKREARESVGVHCMCDGVPHVIEYSELDIYPKLLETDADGKPVHFAGNPAIHVLDIGFVERVYNEFERFPWHRAHKKIPYIDNNGQRVEPDAPNGYKFETFIFDALQLTERAPVALEILAPGEYTPIKQMDGPNSVTAARASMAAYWSEWLEAAGMTIERDGDGNPVHLVEISPRFALDKAEFVEKTQGVSWPAPGPIFVDGVGTIFQGR